MTSTKGTNAAPKASAGRSLGSQIGIVLSVAMVWGVLLLVLPTGQGCSAVPPTPSTGPLTWDDAIGPLMAKNCVVCHGSSGGLSLDTYAHAMQGGLRGPDIVPGDGQNSRLVRALRGTEPGLARMPLGRPPLPDAEINLVAAWIDAGAPQSAANATQAPATAAALPTGTSAPAATDTLAPAPTAVPPTAQPAATVAPTAPAPTQPPAATDTSAAPVGDPAKGAAYWRTSQCMTCHGPNAEGNLGPKLAGTSLTFQQVLTQVRTPRGVMPAFNASRVSDQTLRDVYAWLRTLQ